MTFRFVDDGIYDPAADDPAPCVFTEDFEGDELDTSVWTSWTSGNTSIQVASGLIEFVLPNDGGNANVSMNVGNLENSSVTVTLGHVPPGSMIEQDFMLEDGAVSLRFSVRGGDVLLATWDGTWNPLPMRRTTTTSGDRLRFVDRGGELVAERASGGDTWSELWSGPPPIVLGDVELRLRALGPAHASGHPSFASVAICPQP